MIRTGLTLDVDVAAEIELLSRSMVQGVWQVPAEVARLALRHGARAVEVARRGAVVTVSARGGTPPPESLLEAAVAADSTRSEAARHAAAVALEAAGDLSLLWALAVTEARIRLTVASGARRVVVMREGSGPVRVGEGPESGSGVRLEMRLPRAEARRAVDWMRAACRYAATPVRLDGEDLRRGIGEGTYRLRLDDPLPCVVHLGTSGDGPSLRLLRHEVLVTRATVPGYPRFVAAVELAGVAPESGSAADHRAAVTPHLPALVDRVAAGMLRLVDELPRLDRSRAAPLVRELLRSAALGVRADDVRRAPLVEVVDPRGRSSWRALDALTASEDPPPAVDPADVDHRPHGPVAVLDDEARRLAEAVTARRWPVAVRTARRRSVGSRAAALWAGLVEHVRRWWPGRRAVVSPDRLTTDEHRLEDVLERWAAPPDGGEFRVRWIEGDRPPVARGSILELGREHRDIRHAIARGGDLGPWEEVVAYALLPTGWGVRGEG